MRCQTIKKSSIRRRGSTVVNTKKNVSTHNFLNEFCEVTQSQRILKEASVLFNSLEDKLK